MWPGIASLEIEEYEKDGIIMLEKSAMKTKFEEWKALL